MLELTWTVQTLPVGLLRYIPGGKQEEYTEEVNMVVAEGTGLGYWYAYEGTPDEALFGTFMITHLASGMRIDAETNTHEETQTFIERMTQPFIWDDESVTIDWHLSSEELQALPFWPDIQMIRRENWMSARQLQEAS